MKVVYKVQDGLATDIRFVSDDYVKSDDETVVEADQLPAPETLSDLQTEKRQKMQTNVTDIELSHGARQWSDRAFRDVALTVLQSGHYVYDICAQIEADIEKLGIRKQ